MQGQKMNPNRKRRLSGAVALLALAAGGLGIARAQQPAEAKLDAPKNAAPKMELKEPVDLKLPPVEVFALRCLKCHGDQGTRYKVATFGLDDRKLTADVSNMMVRRAKLEPTVAEINAMATYVRSLQGGAFVAIANGKSFADGKTKRLLGETIPGSAVALVKDDTVTTLPTRQAIWMADPAPAPPFKIRARHGNVVSELSFPVEQWAATKSPNPTGPPPGEKAAGEK